MRGFKLLVGISMLTIACGETAMTKPPVSEPVEATPRSSSPIQGEPVRRNARLTEAASGPSTAASSKTPDPTPGSAPASNATTTEATQTPPTSPTVSATNTTASPAKVVKVEIIDVEAPPNAATVRVGDTLQVTLPMSTGTSWKIVGDQPTDREFVSGYLGPGTDGMRYVWKIAGAKGKRTIKFVGTDANLPKEAPQVVNLVVTVE